MEFIITEKKFKQSSKKLKTNLKDMGFDISLGASQNLLARTFGSKDYNTILPIIKKHEFELQNFQQSFNALEEFVKEVDMEDNYSSNIYENSMLPKINELFKIYEAAKKFVTMEPLLPENIDTFKKAQLSLFLDLMLTTIECFKFISTLANEEMDLSFISHMNENDMSVKIEDNYFQPLTELIIKAIGSINLSITNGVPASNYQENFKLIFILISSYGINYLTQDELSGIMIQVSSSLMKRDE